MKNPQIEKARQAITTVAENENISKDEVLKEMREAMSEGLNSTDPAVKEMWERIPCKGETPEPEELIAWLAEQVKKKLKP